jgi:hypothetical protein
VPASEAYAKGALPTPDQLDQLLAPVALYPDALLAKTVRHRQIRSRSSTLTTGSISLQNPVSLPLRVGTEANQSVEQPGGDPFPSRMCETSAFAAGEEWRDCA